jgi:hypothetical protein
LTEIQQEKPGNHFSDTKLSVMHGAQKNRPLAMKCRGGTVCTIKLSNNNYTMVENSFPKRRTDIKKGGLLVKSPHFCEPIQDEASKEPEAVIFHAQFVF